MLNGNHTFEDKPFIAMRTSNCCAIGSHAPDLLKRGRARQKQRVVRTLLHSNAQTLRSVVANAW
jgi:hypothetical protein